jgi:hypothetical protein
MATFFSFPLFAVRFPIEMELPKFKKIINSLFLSTFYIRIHTERPAAPTRTECAHPPWISRLCWPSDLGEGDGDGPPTFCGGMLAEGDGATSFCGNHTLEYEKRNRHK